MLINVLCYNYKRNNIATNKDMPVYFCVGMQSRNVITLNDSPYQDLD